MTFKLRCALNYILRQLAVLQELPVTYYPNQAQTFIPFGNHHLETS